MDQTSARTRGSIPSRNPCGPRTATVTWRRPGTPTPGIAGTPGMGNGTPTAWTAGIMAAPSATGGAGSVMAGIPIGSDGILIGVPAFTCPWGWVGVITGVPSTSTLGGDGPDTWPGGAPCGPIIPGGGTTTILGMCPPGMPGWPMWCLPRGWSGSALPIVGIPLPSSKSLPGARPTPRARPGPGPEPPRSRVLRLLLGGELWLSRPLGPLAALPRDPSPPLWEGPSPQPPGVGRPGPGLPSRVVREWLNRVRLRRAPARAARELLSRPHLLRPGRPIRFAGAEPARRRFSDPERQGLGRRL